MSLASNIVVPYKFQTAEWNIKDQIHSLNTVHNMVLVQNPVVIFRRHCDILCVIWTSYYQDSDEKLCQRHRRIPLVLVHVPICFL